jgi:hypothetical protein
VVPSSWGKSSTIERLGAQVSFTGKEICVHVPPGLDWFDLIEYYAFRTTLLMSFLYTLYQVLRHKVGR